MEAALAARLAAMDTPEMLALDVECARCGHPKGRHGPLPLEADKSMRCHSCWLDAAGSHECDCAEYVPPTRTV